MCFYYRIKITVGSDLFPCNGDNAAMRVTIRPLTVGMLTQALHSSCILRLNVHSDQQLMIPLPSESDGAGGGYNISDA